MSRSHNDGNNGLDKMARVPGNLAMQPRLTYLGGPETRRNDLSSAGLFQRRGGCVAAGLRRN